jgi:Spy/CpxP family protein refolding chaperone
MRSAIATIIPVFFLVAACDTETDSYEPEARQVEQPADEAPVQREAPRDVKQFRHGMFVERLCMEVSCDDDQHAAITALFESAKPRERPDRDARRPANKALADAFRSDSFSEDDLAAYHAAMTQLRRGRLDGREALVVDLHSILRPEQRDLLADRVAEGRMPFMRGRGHRGGWGPDAKGADDLAANDRVAQKRRELRVEVVCARLECSDQQRTQIAEIMSEAKPRSQAKREPMKQAREKLAAAFRSDDFSEEDMDAFKAGGAALMQGHMQARGETIARVHGVLTPEQREKVASKIEQHGPRGLLGGKHGRRGKHGKRGGHRGHKGPWGGKGFDSK